MNKDQKKLISLLKRENINKPEGEKWSVFLSRRLNNYYKYRPAIAAFVDEVTSFLPKDATAKERIYNILLGHTSGKYCLHCNALIRIKYKDRDSDFCSLDCANASPIVVDRRKRAFQEKYGVSSPAFLSVDARKNTCLQKYGVDNPAKSEKVKLTARKTNRKRYGWDHFFQSDAFVQSHRKKKLLASYGLLDRSTVSPLFTADEYIAACGMQKKSKWNKFPFRCNNCGTEFKSIVTSTKMIPRCPTCFPYAHNGTSLWESNLAEYLSKFTLVETKNRELIAPYEVDLFLPEYKIAIECNGLYWHSEAGGKDKHYHQQKMLSCRDKGVHLLTLWEDQWFTNKQLLLSMLRYRLRRSKYSIGARSCTLATLSSRWFTGHHIEGWVPGSFWTMGLYYGDKVVAGLSIGRSRFTQHPYEILRFAVRQNWNVPGAFSRLLSAFKSTHTGSILTYASADISYGNVYQQAGFQELGLTSPGYWYFKNQGRESRHKYRSSSVQNMVLRGYTRIWNCGNWKFLLPQ